MNWTAAALTLLLGLSGAEPKEDHAEPSRKLELSVEECVYKALQNNPDLAALDFSEQARAGNVEQAWGTFDPIFSSSYQWTRNRRESVNFLVAGASDTSIQEIQNADVGLKQTLLTGGTYDLTFNASANRSNADSSFAFFNPSFSTVLQMQVTQPLLKGAWTTYNKSGVIQAEVELLKSEKSFDEKLIQTIYDVQVAYWDLVFMREDVEVKKFAVQLAEELFDINQKKVEEGVSAPVEVLQAETEIAMRKEDLIRAQNSLRAAEDTLKQLVFPFQDPEEWNIQIQPSTPVPGPDLTQEAPAWQSAVQNAFKNRPELERSRLDLRARELAVEVAENELLPSLNFNGQASNAGLDNHYRRSFQDIQGSDFPSYSLGLSLEVPIGNVGAKGKLRAAKLDLAATRQTLKSQENVIAREVRDAIREFLFSRERIQATKKSRELAKEQLDAELKKFEVGLSTNFQVLEFQRDYSQALSDEKSALVTHAKALVGIERAQGTLKP